jgi:hypothetical protein
MFSTSLLEFETKKNELHRQAEDYRLAKSLGRSNAWIEKLLTAVGKMMVESGQQLVRNHQSAHTAQC